MSAPRTDIEKQKRWHRGPLIGMGLAVIVGVGLIFFWLMKESADGASPGSEDQQQSPSALENAAPLTDEGPAP